MVYFLRFVCMLAVASAFSSTPTNPRNNKKAAVVVPNKATAAASIAAAIGFAVLLSAAEPALALSKTAGQITLDSLPPTTISIQVKDLPVIGNLLSGTYARVPDGSVVGKPSIVIKSPSDKIGAIKSVVGQGHLEFDVNGILATHLDVDIGAEEAGVAKIRVASNLIPQLPFKNAATQKETQKETHQPTPKSYWDIVTNLGSGDSYYYNEATGVSQTERPAL